MTQAGRPGSRALAIGASGQSRRNHMSAPFEESESAQPSVAAAATPPESRFWPLVREALAGSRRDLTAMPLGRAVLLIAIPMILEMIAESIFAVVDIFWVSKLGANAIAAVGLTESLMTIVYAGAMGL